MDQTLLWMFMHGKDKEYMYLSNPFLCKQNVTQDQFLNELNLV